jgi:signal transduction histidine kinase
LPAPGWSPLRVGLASAWLSALVALTAAGLSGWSLADLAERRSRFVAAVTHELRTPLTTLRLYLDLLTNGLVRDASTRDEYLATLQAEADRLHRLVANVLDFARLERGSPQAGRVTVAVSELAQRVVEEWQPICQRAGRELVMDSSLDVAATCHTDPELVRQVLGILIDNAIKHGGNVNDPTIRLEVHQRAGMLICAIEDQGPGVVPADRRRLFRPFQRGRNAATTGGVGLGLALASRWARLLGGRLTVVPGSDGCGARFELAIPL